jgi:hypothetical protein
MQRASSTKFTTVTDPRRKLRTNRTPVQDFVFIDDEKNIPTDPNTMDAASTRRPPVRMNPQDGPWSVSVAETPGDDRSYSLYIKSEFLLVYRATESNSNQHRPTI